MSKNWIIKNHDGDFLVGFFADGKARWRSPSEVLAISEIVVYSTADLSQIAIPALARADVDVYTIERHS